MSGQNPIEIWRMNAFTDRPFSGNPAGVVLDGDELSDEQMQQIAPQMNTISETVYVCTPTVPSADIYLRYFTSTTEVDLCGHATISALFALVQSGRVSGLDETRILRAQTRAGVLELGLEFVDGRLVSTSMTQPRPEHHPATAPELAAHVLGIDPRAIRKDIATACASTGIWSCYVPLTDLETLGAVAVDHEAIETLWPENKELAGVYPFVITGEKSQADNAQSIFIQTQGRFFCPLKYGIAEDPVTGTASGALAAYLIDQGVLDAKGELEAHQGVEMGNHGSLHAHLTTSGAVQIHGQAVPIYRGYLTL